MKPTIAVIGFVYLCNLCFAQIVNIPDANFKSALVGNSSINTNGDGEIKVSEAAAFSGTIDVSLKSIADLTGIEAFTALTGLYCSYNQLTSLDVSANTALTVLDCSSNQLTSLDVSANTALTVLNCSSNQLTSLDVSSDTALTYLYCHSNQLTSLDVSANTALIILTCYYNQLTSFDISANTALTLLHCHGNQLTSLDVSANTALNWLDCGTNQLTSLDVKNGNNTNFLQFNATGNLNLTCIQVDDTAYSNANWVWYIDSTSTFSENCATVINEIQHSTFNIQHLPNPFSSNFTIHYSLAETGFVSLKLFDVTGKLVSVIANEKQTKGEHTVRVQNLEPLRAGIYYYQLTTDEGTETKKIIKN